MTGSIILRARESSGLTQEALAERVGVSRAYLSRLEQLKQRPSDAVRTALIRALHLTAEEARVWDDQRSPIHGAAGEE
jgi:transcriptional regulator with XRE-family HTH domain